MGSVSYTSITITLLLYVLAALMGFREILRTINIMSNFSRQALDRLMGHFRAFSSKKNQR